MGGVPSRRARRRLEILTYAPLAAGLALLVAGRVVPQLSGAGWAASGLVLIALSCFIFAATPGAGEIAIEREVALKRLGIGYRPAFGRAANALFGIALLGAAAWLLAGR